MTEREKLQARIDAEVAAIRAQEASEPAPSWLERLRARVRGWGVFGDPDKRGREGGGVKRTWRF